MASPVHKLLRRSSCLISRTLQSPIKACPSPLHQHQNIRSLLKPLLQNPAFLDIDPSLDCPPPEKNTSKADAFPAFPGFQFCLTSSPVAGSKFSVGCEEDSEESSEDSVVRADSVKKKRKKKMNKHKYRKLRKRLRRQT